MGMSVGPVYVIGYALLQQEVDDDMRGRVFSSLNTLVRLCILISMVVGPLLAALLGSISASLFESEITIGGITIWLPGVRLALWLAASIIVMAGFAAMASLRAGQREHRADESPHPSRGSTPIVRD
jgi:dTMP kinase